MTFITKVTYPIVFISTDTLVRSKRLINRKIKHVYTEMKRSDDVDFKKSCKRKIRLMRLIVSDLKDIILTFG